ncbi:hypothetical protein ACFL6X_01190 [Candidatus Latescibacterota bacterium]
MRRPGTRLGTVSICLLLLGTAVRAAPYTYYRNAPADSAGSASSRNTIQCRYVESAPLGAAGWVLSGWATDDRYSQSRFMKYGAEDAGDLATDINVDREGEPGGTGGPRRRTSFSMVYDRRGWHIFILSQEPQVERLLDAGDSAGQLEMAFSPGPGGGAYYQWIIDLATNEISVYDWDSPHRHYRSLKGRIRSETVALDSGFGTLVFVPWACLYDKLPLDGGAWPFSVIRWMPGGGVTWGGKVHEVGRWGLVEWELPDADARTGLLRTLIRSAWGTYTRAKPSLVDYWADDTIGDPAFYTAVLDPVVRRLDERGEIMERLDTLRHDEVEVLFEAAVPDWMEFSHLVDELRREYLAEAIFAD